MIAATNSDSTHACGNPESHLYTNAHMSSEDPIAFVPRDIVLAKVKGYPPWPAMVLDEEFLPANIKLRKPKNIKPARLKRQTYVVPVRFFSDDTYIWIKDSDIRKLSEADIAEYVATATGKRRQDHLLNVAYELAQNPPDMSVFIKYGSKGEPPVEDPVEEEVDSSEDDEDDGDVDGSEEDDDEEENGAPPAKKRKASAVTPRLRIKPPKPPTAKAGTRVASNASGIRRANGSSGAKAAKKGPDPYAGYDDDWGLDETEDGDAENYVFDDAVQQRGFEQNFPLAQTIIDQVTKKSALLEKIRSKLFRLLLVEDDAKEADIIKELRRLDATTFPVALVRSAQLPRLFITVMRRPVEELPLDLPVRVGMAALLKRWLALDISPNEQNLLGQLPTQDPLSTVSPLSPSLDVSHVDTSQTNGVKHE